MPTLFKCPHCLITLEADSVHFGRQIACPHCGKQMTVPRMPSVTVPPSVPPARPIAPIETTGALDFLESQSTVPSGRPAVTPTRRSSNQDASQWAKIAGGVVVGIIILAAATKGCKETGNGGGNGGGDRLELSITDFIDHTDKYKTAHLHMEMMFTPDSADVTLERFRGGIAKFKLFDLQSVASGEILIQIPRNIEVPRASFSNMVVVEFDCNQGSLLTGNMATGIQRP